MNGFLLAAAAVMALGLGPCVVVVSAGRPIERLVGLALTGPTASVVLLLVAQGLNRSSYVDTALVLAALSTAGCLVFARLLGRSQ